MMLIPRSAATAYCSTSTRIAPYVRKTASSYVTDQLRVVNNRLNLQSCRSFHASPMLLKKKKKNKGGGETLEPAASKAWLGSQWIMNETAYHVPNDIKLFALGRTWLAVDVDGKCSWGQAGIPKGLEDLLWGRQKTLPHPNLIVFGSYSDWWFVQFEDGSKHWQGLDSYLDDALKSDKSKVQTLAVGQHTSSFYCKWESGRSCWNDLPGGLQSYLHGNKNCMLPIDFASMGPDGDHHVKQILDGGERIQVTGESVEAVKSIKSKGKVIHQIHFGKDNSWLVIFQNKTGKEKS